MSAHEKDRDERKDYDAHLRTKDSDRHYHSRRSRSRSPHHSRHQNHRRHKDQEASHHDDRYRSRREDDRKRHGTSKTERRKNEEEKKTAEEAQKKLEEQKREEERKRELQEELERIRTESVNILRSVKSPGLCDPSFVDVEAEEREREERRQRRQMIIAEAAAKSKAQGIEADAEANKNNTMKEIASPREGKEFEDDIDIGKSPSRFVEKIIDKAEDTFDQEQRIDDKEIDEMNAEADKERENRFVERTEKKLQKKKEREEQEQTTHATGFGIFRNLKVVDMFSEDIEESDLEEDLISKPVFDETEGINDDEEGYLKYAIGDVLNKRYQITSFGGRGVFSCVVKAIDFEATDEKKKTVAIKIIRSNQAMVSSGMRELKLLRLLNEKDPTGKNHCIQLYDTFTIRNHLCISFEELDMNLRMLLRTTHGNGINLTATRLYTAQVARALKYLHSLGYVHADLKPDNILVTANRSSVKLCDFGSAIASHETGITEELASRFYRPPEAILGLPYGYGVDVWALGCVTYELFTGKITFPGRTNNEMLRYFMELRGKFSKKMLSKAQFTNKHFESDLTTFVKEEYESTTHLVVRTVRVVYGSTPTKDLGQVLRRGSGKLSDAEENRFPQLKEFLDKCLTLDPQKRLNSTQLFSLSFLK